MITSLGDQLQAIERKLAAPYSEYFYQYFGELERGQSGTHWLVLLWPNLSPEEKQLLDFYRVFIGRKRQTSATGTIV